MEPFRRSDSQSVQNAGWTQSWTSKGQEGNERGEGKRGEEFQLQIFSLPNSPPLSASKIDERDTLKWPKSKWFNCCTVPDMVLNKMAFAFRSSDHHRRGSQNGPVKFGYVRILWTLTAAKSSQVIYFYVHPFFLFFFPRKSRDSFPSFLQPTPLLKSN